MPTFEVLRSYASVDVYHIEAATEEDALRKAESGEGHVKTYDGDDDLEVTISLLEQEVV